MDIIVGDIPDDVQTTTKKIIKVTPVTDEDLKAKDKKFSRTEVARHNTKDDCWIVYKNKAYDVTKFVDVHPAGPNYLTDYAGTDASVEYDQVGHTGDAYDILQTFYVGDVTAADYIDPTNPGVSLPWT